MYQQPTYIDWALAYSRRLTAIYLRKLDSKEERMTLDEFIKKLQDLKKSRKGSGKYPVTMEMERLEDIGDIEIRDGQGKFVPDPTKKKDGINPKTKHPYLIREEISIITIV